MSKNEIRNTIIISSIISLIILFLMSTSRIFLTNLFIGIALITGVVLFTALSIYFLSQIDNVFGKLNHWIDIKVARNNDVSETLGVDYINQSIHYISNRLGESENRFWSRNKKERGKFIVDGDYITVGDIAFKSHAIQWMGIEQDTNNVRVDVNIDGWWYRLYIDPGYGGAKLNRQLRMACPKKLRQQIYLTRSDTEANSGIKAHTTQQNLHGIFEDIDAVELYITPLWLVVLLNGFVIEQHFIDDIEDIRAIKHPTHINDDMFLISFSIGDYTLMYASDNSQFATRLSDATRSGFDKSALRKKKQKAD